MRIAYLTVTAATVVSAATPAEAGVLKLFAEVHGGGMYGKGTSGDITTSTVDAAFFEAAPPGTYGVLVGAELVFLAGWIQHHQFTDGDRLATWTQFGLGIHGEIPIGDQTPEMKKQGKGSFFEVGAGGWFGLGTGQQVDPPLSNDELTDKGFLLEGRIGFGKHLNKVFDVGVLVPVSWGYFLKSGVDEVATDLTNHYQSIQVEGLLYLRANLRLL